MGYTATESVDEFALSEGEMVLVRRKVTAKEVPPDIAAVRLLLEADPDDRAPDAGELEAERNRLIEEWRKERNGTNRNEL